MNKNPNQMQRINTDICTYMNTNGNSNSVSKWRSFISSLIFFTILFSNATAQTKTSAGSGDWNNANTWSPTGVPTAANDVVITSNHRVNIVSNSACRSLTVGTGGSAQLRFDSGTNRTFSERGNIYMGTIARFSIRGQNATHRLFANGDITYNRILDLFRSNKH